MRGRLDGYHDPPRVVFRAGVIPLGRFLVAASNQDLVASSILPDKPDDASSDRVRESRPGNRLGGSRTMDIHLERFVEEVGLLGYEVSPPCDGLEDADELAAEALRQVEGYFRTERTLFELPLHLEGRTEFARAVFDEVTRRVPFGATATYDAIAARAGRPRAARAVGNLMAKCPFSLLVPCHRIVHASPRRADQLRSRWDRQKQWLLEFESGARDSDGLLVPMQDIDDTP